MTAHGACEDIIQQAASGGTSEAEGVQVGEDTQVGHAASTRCGGAGMRRRVPIATTVCLVRHGETDWNIEGRLQGRDDVPLNERGRDQAALCADLLACEGWDILVTSPLSRAAQTGRIIADRLGISVVLVMEEFIERDYGAAAGLTPREREERYPGGKWPRLESRELVTTRCRAGLSALTERYPGRRIVVVSHGAAINAILADLSGGEIGSGKTMLANACLSLVRFHSDAWEIESYNVVSHLDGSGD